MELARKRSVPEGSIGRHAGGSPGALALFVAAVFFSIVGAQDAVQIRTSGDWQTAWSLVGSAALDTSLGVPAIRLTNGAYQTGAAWFNMPLYTTDFTGYLDFQVSRLRKSKQPQPLRTVSCVLLNL